MYGAGGETAPDIPLDSTETERGTERGTDTQVESLEAYVLRGLKALRVDDDLCEYFGGMMMAMALSLEEGSSVDDGFDEGVDNLVELLVDGYGCEEAAARVFVTNAPGLTPDPRSKPTETGQRNSKQRGTDLNSGPGERRVHALPGASKWSVGVGVTDYVDPEEHQSWYQ